MVTGYRYEKSPEESLPLGYVTSIELACLACMLARDGTAVTSRAEVASRILRYQHDTLGRVSLMRRFVAVNRSGGMTHSMCWLLRMTLSHSRLLPISDRDGSGLQPHAGTNRSSDRASVRERNRPP